MLCRTTEHSSNCVCPRVHAKYNQRPYKCELPACPHNRTGFAEKRLFDEHLKHLDRLFKCSVKGCKYERVGFASRRLKDKHVELLHKPSEVPRGVPPDLSTEIDKDNIMPILIDIVKTDNIVALQQAELRGDISQRNATTLVELAARSASLKTFEILLTCRLKWEMEEEKYRLLKATLSSGRLDKVEHLFSRINPRTLKRLYINSHHYSYWALISDSEEIWESWPRLALEEFPLRFWEWSRIIRATKDHPERAHALIAWWSALKFTPIRDTRDVQMLARAAIQSDSLILVKHLLKGGIPVFLQNQRHERTLLQVAARRTSFEAAQMMELLLSYGADPTTRYIHKSGAKLIRDEKGAQGIYKHLGMTWDELVEKTSKTPMARAAAQARKEARELEDERQRELEDERQRELEDKRQRELEEKRQRA